MNAGHTLWQDRPLNEGIVFSVQAGPLRIWLQRWRDEFHYASKRLDTVNNSVSLSGDQKPDDIAWNRWICGKGGDPVCHLTPVLPPRPVIVKPAMPLQVMPGETVALFVSIPIWVRISLTTAGGSAVELMEEPTQILSNSWFGRPVEGELCYALKTMARRRLEDLRADVHLAVCPLTIKNEAQKTLHFDRLCLRLQFLSLYAGATHLWTNHGTLINRGEDVMTGLRVEAEPPALDGATRMLSGPREIARRGAVQRAFNSMKTMGTFWE